MKQNEEMNRLGKGRGRESVREAGKVKIFQTVPTFCAEVEFMAQHKTNELQETVCLHWKQQFQIFGMLCVIFLTHLLCGPFIQRQLRILQVSCF